MANAEIIVSSQLLSAKLHCSTLHFESLDPELETEETEGISIASVCTDVLYLTLYTKVCTDVPYLTLYTKVYTDVPYLTLYTKVCTDVPYFTLYTKVCTDVPYLTLYTKVCTDVPYVTLYTKVCNSICSCNTYLPLHVSNIWETYLRTWWSSIKSVACKVSHTMLPYIPVVLPCVFLF